MALASSGAVAGGAAGCSSDGALARSALGVRHSAGHWPLALAGGSFVRLTTRFHLSHLKCVHVRCWTHSETLIPSRGLD